MIFSVSIKSSQSEFIKSFNLSPFLPTKASHSHFESKPLQVYIGAFNVYIREHNLTYKAPCQIRYGKQYKSKKKEDGITAKMDSIDEEKAVKCFKVQFEENKKKRTLQELKDAYY